MTLLILPISGEDSEDGPPEQAAERDQSELSLTAFSITCPGSTVSETEQRTDYKAVKEPACQSNH